MLQATKALLLPHIKIKSTFHKNKNKNQGLVEYFIYTLHIYYSCIFPSLFHNELTKWFHSNTKQFNGWTTTLNYLNNKICQISDANNSKYELYQPNATPMYTKCWNFIKISSLPSKLKQWGCVITCYIVFQRKISKTASAKLLKCSTNFD